MNRGLHPVASRAALAALGLCLAAAPLPAASRAAQPAAPVDFNAQIRPIISSKCFACHGPDEDSRKAKLRLDLREEAIRERKGRRAIAPGDLNGSELIRRITSLDPDEVMPPPKAGHPLTGDEIDQLKHWVQHGAPYAEHWAFLQPRRVALPKVRQKSWPHNAIDSFILEKLEKAGLEPSPRTDPYTLIRRVSLDLTGLPPAPEEVDAFAQDRSSDAYEKLVDRLLKSPAYGERWARVWLDLARYADSAGYGSDPLRLNIWPWRNWVIHALNRNLPFDRFTLEQLAGDLLDEPDEDQLIATAFHRNTMTNTEGGTDDEEWRVAAVKDRANVTLQVWMGLTMGCAQCHTHKFDPITQAEYYQFYALFNQTEDHDQPDERPSLPVPTKEEREKTARLRSQIDVLEEQLHRATPDALAELAEWERAWRSEQAWSVLEPVEFQAAPGTALELQPDKSLLARGEVSKRDTYVVKAQTQAQGLTGIRLEALPDDSLPKQGPGRAGGNFVLNELSVSFKPAGAGPPRARFVRIELPGQKRYLSLAEVQVFSGGTNVAGLGQASQSSTDLDGAAALAIDGNTNGHYANGKSTTHTKADEDPWWEVDLGSEKPVDEIVLWNRTDSSGDRLSNFRVRALDAVRGSVWETKVAESPSPSVKLDVGSGWVVPLRFASADYSAKDFAVETASDGRFERKSGWAVGGSLGKAHVAVFELGTNLGPGELTFRLVQTYGDQHTLGRFRLSATTLPSPVRFLPANIASLVALPPPQRTEAQQQELQQWFFPLARVNEETSRQWAARRQELGQIRPMSLPIMRELAADKRRPNRLLNKGNFLAPGQEVSPGAPAAFHPWPAGAPRNRLGAAQWLTSKDNPLTARVAVNRLWAQLFGIGIVETEEDFGTQGALPTHPELLDWLALDLMDGGWDVKALLRTIVLSATYQQSSAVAPERREKDPRNRLYGRAPRWRLDAEMVRDQALALSGLLSRKVGGPSVYPPQPDGLWRAAFNGERTYPTSKGEDRYRRALYTVWRRTIPYPSMATFDAPSRETCTVRRIPTNTPLQAFVTLNDPVYFEAAQALGRRIAGHGGPAVADRVRYGLRLCLARPPEEEQVKALERLYESELEHYRDRESEALKLSTEPLGSLPSGLSAAEAAAWTVVGNVLLNLDGVLTKG